jgi:hypothetical protein
MKEVYEIEFIDLSTQQSSEKFSVQVTATTFTNTTQLANSKFTQTNL